ncbi:MAG: hypothetical protein ACO3MW_07005 [Rhodospirillales bacterium]|jgi:hypothetical protein
MFIRTLDQRLSSQAPFVSKAAQVVPSTTRRRHYYPLRILARAFTVIGVATAVYATALISLSFHSGIIAF